MIGQPDSVSPVLEQRIRTAAIVVAALAFSVVMMAVVGTLVAPRAGDAPAPVSFFFVAGAFFAMIGSVAVRRLMLQPLRLVQVYERSGESGLADHAFRVTIISAALAESVGAIGLVLGIVTGDTYYMYALCFIALLGVLSNFPRARRWRDLSAEISMRTQAGAASSSFGAGS
jgi:hypothetical protein